MPDETDETQGAPGAGSIWTDNLLARAKARSAGNAEPAEPSEPVGESEPTGDRERPEREQLSDTTGRPTLVTRADLDDPEGSDAPPGPPFATTDDTFVIPVAPPHPVPPPPVVPEPMDLDIPGSGAGARRVLIEWGSVMAGALVLAIVVRTFLFGAYYIPSPSMEPTLSVGDRIIVNKMSYRLHDVNRGDLVVFRPTGGETANGIDALIKRVIALPGETVRFDAGRVTIDGGLLLEPYLTAPDMTEGKGVVPWCVGDVSDQCTVPADHVFVMGDNRGNSRDSRFFGPVPITTITGRAFVRIWPPGALDRL
jgi:signal peptidase I